MKKLIFILLSSSPLMAFSQTTSWSSSAPSLVRVDANGAAKKLREPTTVAETVVTIRATTTKNGKTVTSSKQVEVNPFYPGCNSPSVYVNGLWWAGCNVGANISTDYGSCHATSCASGWRLPNQSEYAAILVSRYVSGNGIYASGVFLPFTGWSDGVCLRDAGSRAHYCASNGIIRTWNNNSYDIQFGDGTSWSWRCVKN